MARVKRPEFACRVTTHLSEEEKAALQQIAGDDATTIADVIRRMVRDALAKQARRGLRAVAAR